MLRPSTYDDAACVNAAVEINVLNYNVAVQRRTSPCGAVRGVIGFYRLARGKEHEVI